MRRAKIVDASMTGTATMEIYLGHEYSNNIGALHGAGVSLLFDQFTSCAFSPLMPMAGPDYFAHGPPGGVSRALNVTYLRPIPIPGTVRVHCEVIQNGNSVTFSRGSIISPDGKKCYATC
ncbi:hypothetical protein EV356DRAFT_498986, partial [Viridothelium virens]